MPLSLMLWALFVVPLWVMLLLPLAQPERPPLAFAAGVVVLTAAAWLADRRFGAPGPARHIWPERLRWLPLALLAGLGITILASDVGNVVGHLVRAPVEPGEPPADPQALALKAALLHVGLLLVIVGVAERTLLALHRPWVAIGITVVIAVMPTGTPAWLWPQWALLIGLPAWLFRHTRAISLALVAYLPTIALPLLELSGLSPGITGFDHVEPGTYAFQPWWFDLIGAVLVALGIGPLLRDFEAITDEIEGVATGDADASDDDR